MTTLVKPRESQTPIKRVKPVETSDLKLVDLSTNEVFEDPVGCVELEKLEDGLVRFTVPPRAEQDFPGMTKFDWNGQFFGSFIYQMLNTLHDRKLIELPGVLPSM